MSAVALHLSVSPQLITTLGVGHAQGYHLGRPSPTDASRVGAIGV